MEGFNDQRYTLSMNLAFNDNEMSMRIRFEKPLSDDALLRLSLDNDPWRIERDANGDLIMMTPVNSEGGRVEGHVYAELAFWTRTDGRGEVFGPSAGFTLPDTSVRAADAAWISLARWNALTREQQDSYAPICPEFIIEVRSKSDRLSTLEAKMEMWIANGAQLAWLIDPVRKAVAIYRPGESPELLDEPTSVRGTGPVSGFELVMSRIWQ
jgi:Uma2 family endonuclease